jgi:antitoxin VapB
MSAPRSAKLFKTGSSQAVRLPSEFRFDRDEVYISRDETSGDIVLSTRPGAKAWDDFLALIHSIDAPEDFMAERPMNVIPHERDLFADRGH